MRLSDTKLVQLVEHDPPILVIMDESTGEEVTFDADEVVLLGRALDYFSANVPAYQR